jgi:hypothetical protein
MHLNRFAHPSVCVAIMVASTVGMATPRDYLIANMSGEQWTLKLSAAQSGHGLTLLVSNEQDLIHITSLTAGPGHDTFIIRSGDIVRIRIKEEPEIAGPPIRMAFNLVDSSGKASPDFTLAVWQRRNEFATCGLWEGGPDRRFREVEDKQVLFILREGAAAAG